MKNKTLGTWLVIATSACSFVVASCCLFTGLVGAFAPKSERPRAPVATVAVERAAQPQPPPIPPELCADFDPSSMPALERGARLELDVIVDDEHRPIVVLRHNLPAGTVIAIDVSAGNVSGGTLLATDGRYNDNVEVGVEGPCIVAGPFRAMPPGRYTVTALTPAFAQPPHVESVLGPNHRQLRGRQVHTVMGVRIVRATERVRVAP